MQNRDFTTQNALYWLTKDRIPVTKLLIIANILSLLVIGLFRLGGLFDLLAFSAGRFMAQPWTAITYPLVTSVAGPSSIINLLFAGYWLWMAGGSLERAWGSKRYAIFFVLASAVTALGLFVGGILTGVSVGAAGLWLPIAGITIAFAMMNPEEQIMFMFFIPMKLKYLALLTVALVFFSYLQAPIIGIFALSGCAFAHWYVRSGSRMFDFGHAPRQRRGQFVRLYNRKSWLHKLNPFAWLKEWRERRRLKKFFGKSGLGD